MGQEELAKGGGGQAAFEVGVVEIVAGEISELLGGVFVLASGEGWNLRGGQISFAVLGQKVERFDCIGEGQRSLVFEIFTRHVEQIRNVGIAESRARGMQDARSEKGERVLKDGHVKCVVFVQRLSSGRMRCGG
jgi:hypothetical protein